MLYSIAFKTHIFVSVFTLLAGIGTIALSARGVIRKGTYTRMDGMVAGAFALALYLQLFLGFVTYFALRTSLEGEFFKIPDSANDASLRFWAIEHIALMIFALFLMQIGRLYIRRSGDSFKKFRASLFYNGISLFLILFSVSVALFFR